MLSFRFRGKTERLLTIYDCIKEHPPPGMPPGQIARSTGMRLSDVVALMDATPELFFKLPRQRDGFTRYRLTPAINVREPEEVEDYIHRFARRETWMIMAGGLMILLAFAIAIILIGPALL